MKITGLIEANLIWLNCIIIVKNRKFNMSLITSLKKCD